MSVLIRVFWLGAWFYSNINFDLLFTIDDRKVSSHILQPGRSKQHIVKIPTQHQRVGPLLSSGELLSSITKIQVQFVEKDLKPSKFHWMISKMVFSFFAVFFSTRGGEICRRCCARCFLRHFRVLLFIYVLEKLYDAILISEADFCTCTAYTGLALIASRIANSTIPQGM